MSAIAQPATVWAQRFIPPLGRAGIWMMLDCYYSTVDTISSKAAGRQHLGVASPIRRNVSRHA